MPITATQIGQASQVVKTGVNLAETASVFSAGAGALPGSAALANTVGFFGGDSIGTFMAANSAAWGSGGVAAVEGASLAAEGGAAVAEGVAGAGIGETALGLAVPVLGIIAGVAALAGMFDHKGGPKYGAVRRYKSSGAIDATLRNEDSAGLLPLGDKIGQSFAQLVNYFKLPSDTQLVLGYEQNPLGNAAGNAQVILVSPTLGIKDTFSSETGHGENYTSPFALSAEISKNDPNAALNFWKSSFSTIAQHLADKTGIAMPTTVTPAPGASTPSGISSTESTGSAPIPKMSDTATVKYSSTDILPNGAIVLALLALFLITRKGV